MSPLPEQLIDRWKTRKDTLPEQGVVYWHVLLGNHPEIRKIVGCAQERLSRFTGLHSTPLEWLHITIHVAGPTTEITSGKMQGMLKRAAQLLSQDPPIEISLERVLYHPEAIALEARPGHAMNSLLEAARSATLSATGENAEYEASTSSWIPHLTICYSTDRQPAAPIIAALGRKLPSCEVTIEALDLVIQRGPERLWDWHPVGTVHLMGDHQQRSSHPSTL